MAANDSDVLRYAMIIPVKKLTQVIRSNTTCFDKTVSPYTLLAIGHSLF